MNTSDYSYDQPEKHAAREQIIKAAVNALTTDRSSSPVVTRDIFDKTLGYCCHTLEKCGKPSIADTVKPHADAWHSLHNSRVGVKRPDELQVLFLAGPDPVNDIMMFKQCGVAFENIWAIEKDKHAFAKAVQASGKQGLRVKLHRGTLESFFTFVPQQFDIVYYDATAPLFGGQPSTINVIRELFLNQRLSPLSVLVTNFAEVVKDKENLAAWALRLGNWAHANGTLETWAKPFGKLLLNHVAPNMHELYGEFITKFLIRFAAQLVPWWRAVSLPGSRREYLNDDKMLSDAVSKADTVHLFDNALYPMLRLVLSNSWTCNQKLPTWKQFFDEKIEGHTLGEAVKAVSLIRTFYEKHFDGVLGPTKHVLDACSPELAKVLGSFQWFDQHKKFFCDIPLPNLITDLLLGLYGFPYHANVQKIERFAYKAKETVMFTDILVFDQVRYMYDLLPTLPLFDTDFTLPQQLVLRTCMDALHRHCHYGCKDLFWGSALAGLGEDGFTFWLPGARKCIGDPGVEFNEPDADGYEVAEDSGTAYGSPF